MKACYLFFGYAKDESTARLWVKDSGVGQFFEDITGHAYVPLFPVVVWRQRALDTLFEDFLHAGHHRNRTELYFCIGLTGMKHLKHVSCESKAGDVGHTLEFNRFDEF